MAQNIFARAKQLQKQHPNKSWKELVKMAAKSKAPATKQVTSNSSNMATTRRKTGTKRRKSGVGAVKTVYKTRTVKAATKRRSVGAIIDKQMLSIAGGMALTGVVQGMIEPFRGKLPVMAQKFVDPAMVIVGYMGSQKLRNPIAKGVALGLMAAGVKNTTQLIMGMVQPAPMIPQVVPQPGGRTNVGYNGDMYMALPNMSGVSGFIGTIEQSIAGADNDLVRLDQNVGGEYTEGNYLPLGWDSAIK